MPIYKLYYFDIRGLAEPIRLALAIAGVDFEDVRIKKEDWMDWKHKMPFGQLPVLEVDGKMLTQSMSIMRFIGRTYGLEAADPWDRAVGDELSTSWLDMFTRMAPAFGEQDKEAKKQKFLQVIEEFVKPRLKVFDDRLAINPSGLLAGNKVTWCDLSVYNWLVMIKEYLRVSLQDYPNLQGFVNKIDNLPAVKEFSDRHPDAKWSVMPSPFD